MMRAIIVALLPLAIRASGDYEDTMTETQYAAACSDIKSIYKDSGCCGNPDHMTAFTVVPGSMNKFKSGDNYCHGTKPDEVAYFDNVECKLSDGVLAALEQSGVNVTEGYVGGFDTGGTRPPINTTYLEAGLCPVNVHWHIGTEHYSMGEYDETGSGPDMDTRRRLGGGDIRKGFQCTKFDPYDPKFTTEYEWIHCNGMHVGETYEVHWPHSAAGACGTPYQYQYPFYDGVFCRPDIISLEPLNTFLKIGVQGQIFTIVNDEDYYYPDLARGAIMDGDYWNSVAKYTGSTTGTTRSNEICSKYTPITWQVDRKCHLISASSFDKMCADMKAMADDMAVDLEPHGARELVDHDMAADNQIRL
jgi:hypothetical protein